MVEAEHQDLEVVAINDLGSTEANAHLFRYDSTQGRFPGEVEVKGDTITLRYKGRTWGPIKVSAEKDPTRVPYQGVDVALECTGRFTSKADAAQLLAAGAKKVLISAPSDDAEALIAYGVNEGVLTRDMTIVSNGSCTTNCLAPVTWVLHKNFGVERGYMVTVHSYTGDQRVLDTLHKDLHRARAAGVSIIPTTTGAAKSIGKVLPELQGKLDGTSIRVPTPVGSVISLDVVLKQKASKEEVIAAMREASAGPLKGILEVTDVPLVSTDFIHNPASAIFDAPQTAVVDGGLVRVMAWYDNEWGFSNRMSDTAVYWGKL
jgi:glyceraldehyde 3-phosphate dehydrogenase